MTLDHATLDHAALRALLHERLYEVVNVDERPDGALMLRTHFRFPDGDSYPFYLLEGPAGELRLSDEGDTLMRMSYEQDIDAILEGARRVLMDRILGESGLEYDDGTFYLDIRPERLPEAMFAFGQALTRLYDLTLHSRAHVRSTFEEDLGARLTGFVEEDRIRRQYCPPEVPHSGLYPVDYRIDRRTAPPLFLYGVHNENKARRTTITLAHFRRHDLQFDSLIVFQDQTAIPRNDLVRLTDVAGDMISSLEAEEDLRRHIA